MIKINKKAAIELSMNFIVILIISIVVFSFGIYFIGQLFMSAEELELNYDSKTEKEVERMLLQDDKKVAIPFRSKTIPNGEFDTFAIGVRNIGDIDSDFYVSVGFSKAYDKSGGSITVDTSDWLKSTYSSVSNMKKTIEPNKQEIYVVGVEPKGAQAGTYVFDVFVCNKDDVSGGSCDGSSKTELYESHVYKLFVEVV